ncbi:aspartate dehydrogenase [Pusillimonas sp.]|uniref:aspartate dehydrogenase n=1 Tax=Pusillimonas sp. TaxID=3040095 RepID=UPI0029B01F6F|nr:aspartate dehydrogenase [Pusillimonas sp.]MDX3893098.1 aspartate dehydrogenase [Pusillimonas sp.]
MPGTLKRVAMVGFGAISQSVLDLTKNDEGLCVSQLIVSPGKEDAVRGQLDGLGLKQLPKVSSGLVLGAERPDVLVECAGHGALTAHVLPALRQGVPCLVVSIGALSAPGMAEELEQAAREGGTQVHLLSGAIGGIDALAAARMAGLDAVTYVGRKPPLGWLGSPAEEKLDLRNLKEKALFFEGSAREAARLFPKNANVAATLALAGVGLDCTRVELYADPAVDQNIHYYEAQGAFGNMAVTMQGKPLASNPKTSALTVYSVVRALRNLVSPLAV